MAFFEQVPLSPPDPILGLTLAFQRDPRAEKVDLGVGLYKTEELRTPVLECVKAAEVALLEIESGKEYLPMSGEKAYLDQMGPLVFGRPGWDRDREKIAAFQTVGGTGALRVGGNFLQEYIDRPIWIASPTWGNHQAIFSRSGLSVEHYPYYNANTHLVDFDAMRTCLEGLKAGSTVLLQASCHNPTGCDLTLEQWNEVCEICERRQLIPFFDFAYQGLGAGIEEDAAAIRLFLSRGMEMLVAVSNAKNLSLYGERVGCLFIIAKTPEEAQRVLSSLKLQTRANYSTPPIHGARVASLVFDIPARRQQWETELKQMRERINSMRQLLHAKLSAQRRDFDHLRRGYGMFGFLGLSRPQVERMIADHGIYMTGDSRINFCGLNKRNIDYVVHAINEVTRHA